MKLNRLRRTIDDARLVLAAGLVLIALGCTPRATLTGETATVRGAELLAPLKQELKQALMAGMQEGPLNAISVCKDQAPAIADALSVDGIEIGRTSHRLRNPANVAPDWVTAEMQSYLGDAADRAPKVVALLDDREGYVEPIVVQALCIACHGETLAPDLAAHIDEAYPEDEATGFEVGDLRGVYWVEYPRGSRSSTQ